MRDQLMNFFLAFLLGVLYWRLWFWLWPGYFKKPLVRSVLGLRWHHVHYGIIFSFFAAIWIIVSGVNSGAVILLGLGLGFIIDEFTFFLMYETDRDRELQVYRQSFTSTLIVLLSARIIVFALLWVK